MCNAEVVICDAYVIICNAEVVICDVYVTEVVIICYSR